MEIWKDVIGYEGLYQVSNLGRVKGLKSGKILTPADNGNGYLRFSFYLDGKQKTVYLHRLLAEAFIPNPLNLSDVNHKNENKYDNRLSNLEWLSHIDNCNHGTRNQRTGDKVKVPVLQYTLDGKFVKSFDSIISVQRELGFKQTHIVSCAKGHVNKAYGYVWKYKDKEVV